MLLPAHLRALNGLPPRGGGLLQVLHGRIPRGLRVAGQRLFAATHNALALARPLRQAAATQTISVRDRRPVVISNRQQDPGCRILLLFLSWL